MFKKKPNIKSLAPLRSSDRRKVVDEIISLYGIQVPDTIEQAEGQIPGSGLGQLRNSLLPDGALSAKFTTTTGAGLKTVNGTVYVGSYEGDEQRILWFRIDNRTIPSVYTLWRHPSLVPLLHTPDIVLEKIKGGADLMTPGLADKLPFPAKATRGSLVAVAGLDHPSVPVAVGECMIDISSLQSVGGAKGHAVRSLHWHGDEIWNWSHNDRPGLQPPDNISGWSQANSEADRLENVQASFEDLSLDNDNEEDGGVPLNSVSGNEREQNVEQVSRREWTTNDVDSAFRKAFLYSVWQARETRRSEPKYGIDLPIDQSKFMSNHILPFLPIFNPHDAESLQIKKTSWKNVKKFIKALDKEVLIKSKDRQGGEMVVLDIDFEDAAILSFTPYDLPKKHTNSASSTSTEPSSMDDSLGQTIKRLVLLKPNERLAPLLRAANASRTDLYLSTDIRDIVKQYIETENLINNTNKRLVNIDPVISDAVLDPSTAVDAEVLRKGTIPRDILLDRIASKCCTPYYSILKNDQARETAKPKAGSPPSIRITMETRSGNKTATKVSGLEFYHIRPALFKEELQKTCASSTTMGLLPGSSPKDNLQEIMLQGPQKDAIIKALEKRGVRKDWVDFQDKTKKKK